jgi:hypothetical protein
MMMLVCLLRQKFKKLRFQMIDDSTSSRRFGSSVVIWIRRLFTDFFREGAIVYVLLGAFSWRWVRRYIQLRCPEIISACTEVDAGASA